MDFFTLLIQVLNAVQYGLLLFLVAAGLTLIFGMMGIINLAHGSFYMIGAYLSFGLAPIVDQTIGGGFLVTLVVGLIFAIFLGYLLEWLFYSYLYERDHLQQVLMTYGLILVFEEIRSLLLGDDVHSVAIPDWLSASIQLGDIMTYPTYRLFISGMCLLLAAAMLIVLTKTRLGMMIRAGSVNREMTQSLGVSPCLCRRCGYCRFCRNDCSSSYISLPWNGSEYFDHLLCRGSDRRYRINSRSFDCLFINWLCGYLW